jgi:hypothetical protein
MITLTELQSMFPEHAFPSRKDAINLLQKESVIDQFTNCVVTHTDWRDGDTCDLDSNGLSLFVITNDNIECCIDYVDQIVYFT